MNWGVNEGMRRKWRERNGCEELWKRELKVQI